MAYRAVAALFRVISLSLGPALMACLVLVVSGCAGPPVQEMSNARQAIKAAVDAGAKGNGAAARELTEAQQLLERAQLRFDGQAYRQARDNAVAAHSKAKKALSIAQASAAVTPTKSSAQ